MDKEKLLKEKEEREKKSIEEHTRLSKMFKENRFMFEIERKKRIDKLINSAPEEQQEVLRSIQEKWDKRMKGAGDKWNRLAFAESMLMEQFQDIYAPAISGYKKSMKNFSNTIRTCKKELEDVDC